MFVSTQSPKTSKVPFWSMNWQTNSGNTWICGKGTRQATNMELYKLGKVPWQESQLIYHALAKLGREALSLVSPASPYVSIGFHQDLKQEVDTEFCRANEIPLFRRDLGGGAVYLDGDQYFFHLILHKNHPAVTKNKELFYKKFLQPVAQVYRRIGIDAQYKPINDLLAGGRKISGTGVGELGDCIVFVGNLIMDFNYEIMSKVLKVPDEKFRDKIHKTLRDNLSTIRRELGNERAAQWDEETLDDMMADEFGKLVGGMKPRGKDDELIETMDELAARMMKDDWLHRKGGPRGWRDVKIRSGINVVHRVHKAPGGLIRSDYELAEGTLHNVSLSGDFFCFPEAGVVSLESRLEGVPKTELRDRLAEVYREEGLETPGISLDDWMIALGAGKFDG
jgi:lipoate-protein ligase A